MTERTIHTKKGQGLVLVVLDGLGDRPIKELGGKTPLEAARTPVMDRMAKEGCCGLHYPVSPGITPGSALAHMQLFNYGVNERPQRGVVEALGAGLELKPSDTAFRLNFAYVAKDGLTVMDRRAHREVFGIEEMAGALEKHLNKNKKKLKFRLVHTLGHRGVLVVKGYKSRAPIPDTDPHMEGLKVRLGHKLAKWIHETSYKFLRKHRLNREREARGFVPANAVLLRGGGRFTPVSQNFKERNGLNAFGIAGGAVYLGVARYTGMEAKNEPDEALRLPAAVRKLTSENFDFAFVHFKETDNASHDGDYRRKIKCIERYDKMLKILLDSGFTVAVTGDHATPCRLFNHSGDAVPVLFYGRGVPGDAVKQFGERACAGGSLGIMKGRDVLPVLVNLAGRSSIYFD